MLLDGHDAQALQQAAQALARGELVAMPTETVYGLAARADDDAAVAKIFLAKGRPADHPLIVHVLDADDAATFAASLPETAKALMQAFWPGPLTVIVPRASGVATAAAGGQETVGLRSPAHPVARELLQAARTLGVHGVAAPSANRFGRVSPTQARHVQDEFGDALLVLDGGDCQVGIESAIVDCSREFPVLLRPGVLTTAELEAVLGQPLRERDAAAPRASGTLEAHYAPTATVRLKSAEQIFAALPGEWPAGLAVYSRSVPAQQTALWRAMPADALAAAQELFTVLRELDAAGVREIWVETPPPDSAWAGVRDRLSRAAAAFEP